MMLRDAGWEGTAVSARAPMEDDAATGREQLSIALAGRLLDGAEHRRRLNDYLLRRGLPSCPSES